MTTALQRVGRLGSVHGVAASEGRRPGASRFAIWGVVALAAALRLIHLDQVPGNPFYDAAIRTMSVSWHAFLFGGLDPGGTVSVDKPPVDLWVQVASVKLLGFSPTAIKLPQALAGIGSVVLLYDVVRRGFGRGAALAAAAALAVLPVAVLTARSDTMDAFMTFLLLAAAWLVVRAAESGRLAPLRGAGAVAGLAFNVKLFEALLPLPAIALIWLAGSAAPLRRRLAGLAAATAVTLVVAFAWIVPVALTPASQRPYPIGSTNGSVWNLVFQFNGLGRLKERPTGVPDTLPLSAKVPAALAAAQAQRAAARGTGTGPAHLLGPRFGTRIGTELLPALMLGGLAALLGATRLARRRELLAAHRLTVAVAMFIGVWLATGYVVFSAMGTFHPRYFEAVTPAVAGGLGIGLWTLARAAGRLGPVLAAGALVTSALYLEHLGGRAGPGRPLAVALMLAAALGLAGVALGAARHAAARTGIAALAVAALLFIPVRLSADIVHSHAFDAERSGRMRPSWPPRINAYLRAHRGGARYIIGSIAPAKAAPLIVDDPQPVLMLTSYRSRPLYSVPELAAKVRAGEVRYFLLGRRCSDPRTAKTAACPPTAHWVIRHGKDVTADVLPGHHGLLFRAGR